MARPCAVVGIGQTDYRRRLEVSLDGLVRIAALDALDDANAHVRRHRCGRHRQGARCPRGRDHARAVAVSTRSGRWANPSTASTRPGRWARPPPSRPPCWWRVGVTTPCSPSRYEKQSEGNATWALSGGKSGGQGAGGTFAPWIREYIRRSQAPEHIGWTVAVKDRQNALRNPHAHLHIEDISIEKVRESPMLWDPLHFLESCPSSDGAAAMVLTSR